MLQEQLDNGTISRADRLLLTVMMERKVERDNVESSHNYLTEAHKANSEAAMRNIAARKKSKIDWEAESERQKRNAVD
ncbi:MAG TPA: hypothetical protein VF676_12400 [Flavobacterium sp.]